MKREAFSKVSPSENLPPGPRTLVVRSKPTLNYPKMSFMPRRPNGCPILFTHPLDPLAKIQSPQTFESEKGIFFTPLVQSNAQGGICYLTKSWQSPLP